jgi:serine/threonine-protein kinase
MGMVFLARDTTLDRPVAVKVMHPDLSVHGAITQRFLSEARMIARLRHPNIVSIHTAGEATGIFFYVMDHVPGESLRERLNVVGKMDPSEAVRIMGDIADALGAAGRAGLVHRDVKPENILLDNATGRALLADFGIARVAAAEVEAQLTGQGVAVGTPTYMSPEQAAGEGVDPRSDLYGLGVVAYEMLAGQPPFRGPNGAAVISMQLSEKPVPLDKLRPDLSPQVSQTVMRALEKSPENRWQTGADFHAALIGDTVPSLPRRRKARGVIVAGVAALLLMVVAVAMALTRHNRPPDGVDPRHSILILPFDNLRDDRSVDWLREGSVNMLSLNMSQWNDLTVVDHERLHDLLGNHDLDVSDQIGLEMARRIAREAGVWTVVLGDFTPAGDSLHLVARVYDVATGLRISIARVDGLGQPDARPLFDQLAARLLDLSGAPGGQRADLASLTTPSLEAYRAYLRGIDQLNQWELGTAQTDLERAVELDSTFGLAYYKLAITRGWLIGANDSLGERSIRQATRFAERLPQHERTVINAYRSFVEGDFGSSQALYRSLIARDSNDADAWYGLGDALFHDTSAVNFAANQTGSLRAFRKTLGLDPTYSLAYEHIMNMLTRSAEEQPYMALVAPDSFARVFDPRGQRQMDSARVRSAVTLARSEAVTTGRNWVASQPEAARSHTNLIEAYFSSRDYSSALGELQRVRSLPSGSRRADLVFTEGRIRFASGDLEGAAGIFQNALDSLTADDFSTATPMSFQEITSAAALFSYLGDLKSAARAIDLADTVRRVTRGEGTAEDPGFTHFERVALGWLYAGGSGTTRELKRLWMQAADEARTAPSGRRSEIARSGTPAALGLFLGPTGDSAPLKSELPTLTREPQIKEVRALLALDAGNEAEARKILAEPDTVQMKGGWTGEIMDRRPYAAQAYYVLGDFQRTIDILTQYEPENLGKRGFDHRWGMVGRVRLLRAAALEKLGRNADAAAQYRAVLAQWKGADKLLIGEYLKQAEQGLARTTGAG